MELLRTADHTSGNSNKIVDLPALPLRSKPCELSDFTEAVRVATIVLSFDLVGYIVFFY